MQVSYGAGEYVEGGKRFAGNIILGDYKLFLKGPDGDISSTYIPLEKVRRIRRTWQGLEVFVFPSPVRSYRAMFRAPRASLKDLTADLVGKRNLKKKLLIPEWFDETSEY